MRVGECGGRAEVYADSFLGVVCETGLDFTGGSGGHFRRADGKGEYAKDEVIVAE